MRIKPLVGALALATTLVVAACGSTTTNTSTNQATTGSSPGMDTPSDMTTGDTMAMGHDPAATGLTIHVDTTAFEANQQTDLSFSIVDATGTVITDYQVEQTKELHLVLVRSDLTGYQHLHPTRDADGMWSVPVTFTQGGSYRMVADFVPVLNGAVTGRTAITTDLTVNGSGTDTALPAPSPTATIDGFTVQIDGGLDSAAESTVTFNVVDDAGAPAVLEPYLGAFGHLVAFAQSDLAYTHIHPNAADANKGTLEFVGQVQTAGIHRLFLQFAAGGQVHTAEFTIDAG